MKFWLQVVDPDTKMVERVQTSGGQILQILHYVRRLGLTGVVVKAEKRWANYRTFYTLGSDCRLYKWQRLNGGDYRVKA